MVHTIRKKHELLNRIRRIGGQVAAIERALEAEAECGAVLQLIASVRGAANGLMAEVLEEHIRLHVLGMPEEETEAVRLKAADDVVDVVRTYLK
jgi:DNA-binding FrmR family transcriptional regulator